MGRPVIERLMRALVIVVIDVASDFGVGLLNCSVAPIVGQVRVLLGALIQAAGLGLSNA
jgi:hypothetical protein